MQMNMFIYIFNKWIWKIRNVNQSAFFDAYIYKTTEISNVVYDTR